MANVFTPLLALGVATAAIGCYKTEPNYCPENPNHNCLDDAYVPLGCASSSECAAPTPVCDVPAGACVQCTPAEASACTATTPVCGDNSACRACTAHDECPDSLACLPDGSCAAPTDVAYVAPSGTDNAACSLATPCETVPAALATSRPYVKLTGTTEANATVTISNREVTVLADPGAKLTRSTAGVILAVDGTSDVTIYDLTISDGLGATGIGISMPAGNSAKLALYRSTVSGNAGGGISISGGQFEIMNTMITKNGGALSAFGGIKLDGIVGTGTRHLEFTTIAQNQASAGLTPGVVCSSIAAPMSFHSNIVFGNGSGAQVEGANCAWTYSDIGPATAIGTGNINADPMFADAVNNDYHLLGGSPARDTADPAATLGEDIDGQPRPSGARSDMGADEFTR